MPKGLIVMHWDERIGAEIYGKFPNDVQIDEKTMMQLYAQHEYLGSAGSVSLSVGSSNLISYYSGPETQIYVILLLEQEENGFDFEDALVDTTNLIIESKDDTDALKNLIPNFFQRIKAYPTLSPEQKLGLFYQDELKRVILQRFREEMLIPQSEIQIWLKDRFQNKVVGDISEVIDGMIKIGLIKRASIKGDAADLLFMVRDLMMLRHPPAELIRDPVEHHLPKSLKNMYVQEVLKFFKDYKVSDQDNINVINKVILDPACYEVLKLLRIAIVTRNDLEKLKKKGVDDVKLTLKTLWDAKMITVIEDEKKTEYYCLTNDFYIGQFYPAYNIDTIVGHYKRGSRNVAALINALSMMKDEYFIQYPKSKKIAVKARAATI